MHTRAAPPAPLSVAPAEERQQEEEEVEQVEIELDRGDDVVVVPELGRDEVGVVQDEDAEEEGARERVEREQQLGAEHDREDARSRDRTGIFRGVVTEIGGLAFGGFSGSGASSRDLRRGIVAVPQLLSC